MKFKFLPIAEKSWEDQVLGALDAAPATVKITRNWKNKASALFFFARMPTRSSMADLHDEHMTISRPV